MLLCQERKAVLWEAYSLHLEEDESQAGKGTHWKGKNYTKVKWGVLDLLLMGITHSWATGISPFPGLIPVFLWALQICSHLPSAAANPKGAPSRLSWWNRQAFWVYPHINMHTHVYEDTLPRLQRSIFPQPLSSVQACSQFQMIADAIGVRAVMQASVNPQLGYIAPSYGSWPSCTADHKREEREVFRKAKGIETCMTKKCNNKEQKIRM